MIRSPAIAKIIAGLVALDAEVAAMVTPNTGDVYTTAALPPMTSRRTFHEACRGGGVRGAVKTGRSWTCPREAWHAARARKPVPASTSDAIPSDVERARAYLREAGFRPTKVSR